MSGELISCPRPPQTPVPLARSSPASFLSLDLTSPRVPPLFRHVLPFYVRLPFSQMWGSISFTRPTGIAPLFFNGPPLSEPLVHPKKCRTESQVTNFRKVPCRNSILSFVHEGLDPLPWSVHSLLRSFSPFISESQLLVIPRLPVILAFPPPLQNSRKIDPYFPARSLFWFNSRFPIVCGSLFDLRSSFSLG